MLHMVPEEILLVFDRPNVLAMNVAPPLGALLQLIESAQAARTYRHRVRIVFEGYEGEASEVYEHPHVRDFIRQLTDQFPYWLHFACLDDDSLFVVMNCLAPPGSVSRSPDGKRVQLVIDTAQWNEQLMSLFGHMNGLYAKLGLTSAENSETTQAVATWCQRRVGPQ